MLNVIGKAYRNYLLKRDKVKFRKECGKKAVVSYPPRELALSITNNCTGKSFLSEHHHVDAEGKNNVYDIDFRLKFEHFKKMVDMAYKGRVPHIHICGTGEPFLNPDVVKMMDYTISVYGDVSIQTNFFKPLFQKFNYLDELLKRKDNISFITTDILSGDPEQHNFLKNGSNYYDVLDSLQYISNNSNIKIKAHFLLTKINYMNIRKIIDDLSERKINNCSLDIVNLYSYDFNEFTSSNMVYTSLDGDITRELDEVRAHGKLKGINVTVPEPEDLIKSKCDVFWNKIQTWPVDGNEKERYHENLIPHACRAVVKGDLNSLGYIFDYKNVMDFWNNKTIVNIRKNLINDIYPSEDCKYCYSYTKSDSVIRTKNQWKRSAEENLKRFRESELIKGLNENSICIDCGANVGAISEVMAGMGAAVYAFEPNPNVYQVLKNNMEKYHRVTCIQKAVLDKNTTMKLFMHKYSNEDSVFWSQGASICESKDNVNKDDCVDVEVIDLIEFIKELNKPIDILKIDIEGGEYDVLLRIIEEKLYSKIKHILVETHDKRIPEIVEKGDLVRSLIKEQKINNIDLNWI